MTTAPADSDLDWNAHQERDPDGERDTDRDVDGGALEVLGTLVAPWRWLTAPVFLGLEHIPEGEPLLFVGNHTLMGGVDVPLLMEGLWRERGIRLCILGDRIHFRIPGSHTGASCKKRRC